MPHCLLEQNDEWLPITGFSSRATDGGSSIARYLSRGVADLS